MAEWKTNMVEDQFEEFCVSSGFVAPFEVGDTVDHPSGRCVHIVGGHYWGVRGLLNFWYWREVLPDGSLSEILEQGYGW